MESFQETQACKNSKAASSPFYRVTEGESWMPLVQHLFAWRKSSENPCNPLCLQRSLEVYAKYNWIDRCSYGMHVRWVFHAESHRWLSPCGGCLRLWKPENKTIRLTFNELCPKIRDWNQVAYKLKSQSIFSDEWTFGEQTYPKYYVQFRTNLATAWWFAIDGLDLRSINGLLWAFESTEGSIISSAQK